MHPPFPPSAVSLGVEVNAKSKEQKLGPHILGGGDSGTLMPPPPARALETDGRLDPPVTAEAMTRVLGVFQSVLAGGQRSPASSSLSGGGTLQASYTALQSIMASREQLAAEMAAARTPLKAGVELAARRDLREETRKRVSAELEAVALRCSVLHAERRSARGASEQQRLHTTAEELARSNRAKIRGLLKRLEGSQLQSPFAAPLPSRPPPSRPPTATTPLTTTSPPLPTTTTTTAAAATNVVTAESAVAKPSPPPLRSSQTAAVTKPPRAELRAQGATPARKATRPAPASSSQRSLRIEVATPPAGPTQTTPAVPAQAAAAVPTKMATAAGTPKRDPLEPARPRPAPTPAAAQKRRSTPPRPKEKSATARAKAVQERRRTEQGAPAPAPEVEESVPPPSKRTAQKLQTPAKHRAAPPARTPAPAPQAVWSSPSSSPPPPLPAAKPPTGDAEPLALVGQVFQTWGEGGYLAEVNDGGAGSLVAGGDELIASHFSTHCILDANVDGYAWSHTAGYRRYSGVAGAKEWLLFLTEVDFPDFEVVDMSAAGSQTVNAVVAYTPSVKATGRRAGEKLVDRQEWTVVDGRVTRVRFHWSKPALMDALFAAPEARVEPLPPPSAHAATRRKPEPPPAHAGGTEPPRPPAAEGGGAPPRMEAEPPSGLQKLEVAPALAAEVRPPSAGGWSSSVQERFDAWGVVAPERARGGSGGTSAAEVPYAKQEVPPPRTWEVRPVKHEASAPPAFTGAEWARLGLDLPRTICDARSAAGTASARAPIAPGKAETSVHPGKREVAPGSLEARPTSVLPREVAPGSLEARPTSVLPREVAPGSFEARPPSVWAPGVEELWSQWRGGSGGGAADAGQPPLLPPPRKMESAHARYAPSPRSLEVPCAKHEPGAPPKVEVEPAAPSGEVRRWLERWGVAQ
jgi:hypothetical protein